MIAEERDRAGRGLQGATGRGCLLHADGLQTAAANLKNPGFSACLAFHPLPPCPDPQSQMHNPNHHSQASMVNSPGMRSPPAVLSGVNRSSVDLCSAWLEWLTMSMPGNRYSSQPVWKRWRGC